MPKYDPSSGAIVLTYTGPGVVSNVPAADLSANVLVRLAWVRAGQRPVGDKEVTALRDELVATGNYTVAKGTNHE